MDIKTFNLPVKTSSEKLSHVNTNFSDVKDDVTSNSTVNTKDDSTETKAKKDTLNADLNYTLVCVHIETFKVSNESSTSLTQIGCTTALNGTGEKETFFQSIKPARLDHFLDNFKMEGDLLKALHMTEENGKFEFRAQFERRKRKEKNKIFCTSEEEALLKLMQYLEKFQNVILFAVDEDTLGVILGKLAQFRRDKDLPVAGFTTWPKVLDNCLRSAEKDVHEMDFDLEDFYSQHCGKVSGYISALDVANFLRKSVKKLYSDCAQRIGSFPRKKFCRNAFLDEVIEDIKNIETDKADKLEANKPLTVEVFSSFRPAVSTTIGIEHMATIELSSGEESDDSDIDIVEENLKPKLYTKRIFDHSDLLAKKRMYPNDFDENQVSKRPKIIKEMYPNDFDEYQVSKRPNLVCADPIVIDSDSEDEDFYEDDEITLDEEAPKKFAMSRRLDDIKEMLGRNTQLRLTKVKEGSWLGKRNLTPKCCICQIEFEDSQELESHTEKEHMYCKVCNFNFDVLSEALNHKKVHEVPETFSISRDLDDKKEMPERNTQLSKPNQTFNPTCFICQIEFLDRLELESHTEEEHRTIYL